LCRAEGGRRGFCLARGLGDGYEGAQYTNLIALKGKHGTLTAVIPGAVGYTTKTAPARLIDVTGTWEGTHQPGIANWLAVKAVWQLKDFF